MRVPAIPVGDAGTNFSLVILKIANVVRIMAMLH